MSESNEMAPTWAATVRYVECDQQGVVFNSHYLTWADEASMAWWAGIGFPWYDTAALGGETMVRASALDWTSSARWGDTVSIDVRSENVGRTSLVLKFKIRVGDRHCCDVVTTYVWVTPKGPTPWPEKLRIALVNH